MDLFIENRRKSLKHRRAVCFLAILNFLSASPASMAINKIDAILHTQESMQEHTSDEPRRLMCDVLLEQFAKGNVIQIVNRENSRTPAKYHDSSYHVGANLIAFSFATKTPIHISISIQLVEKKSGNVILTSDQALVLDEKAVEDGLKLHKSEFNNSAFGKALTILSKAAAMRFEEKVKQMNLSSVDISHTAAQRKSQTK